MVEHAGMPTYSPLADAVPFAIAELRNVQASALVHIAAQNYPRHWIVSENREASIKISVRNWQDADRAERIAIVRDVMAIAAALPESPQALLIWTFSGVALPRTALASLLDSWSDAAKVPVLALIGLDIDARTDGGRHGIATRGLQALVGNEIEALYEDHARRDLAILVARLAHEAITTGPITATTAIGPDGTTYHLSHRSRGYFSSRDVILIA